MAATVDRDPAELEPILQERGVPGEVGIEPWPRGVELSGDGDMRTVERVLRAAAQWAGPEVKRITLRIEGVEVDLLYSLPRSDFEAAVAALPADVDTFRRDPDEWGRNWFGGRWTDWEEDRLLEEESRPAALTPRQIQELFGPPQHRDRREVHPYCERRPTCEDLAHAMALATTTTQRRPLAHLFTLRPRPCVAAVPHLIRWLEDADEHVAEDAADGLGLLLATIRSPESLLAAQRAAGAALFRYARAHPTPLALIALGVTAHAPARAYLEDLAAGADRPRLQEGAIRALRSFEWYASPDNAGRAPHL